MKILATEIAFDDDVTKQKVIRRFEVSVMDFSNIAEKFYRKKMQRVNATVVK